MLAPLLLTLASACAANMLHPQPPRNSLSSALRLSGGGDASQTVLVTGGVGYIGSHTVLELLDAGYDVVVADNLCNSNLECLRRVQQLAGRETIFEKVDIRDKEALAHLFTKHKIDSVIHFAGLKAVGESVAKPLLYYQVNIEGTLNLVQCMADAGCFNIVFSSSATVYGDPASVPVTESFPTGATNPYGSSKLFNEQILSDVAAADDRWNVRRPAAHSTHLRARACAHACACTAHAIGGVWRGTLSARTHAPLPQVCLLRYFNPVGAHPSGRIGEDPKGIPNNLMPFIQQVAVGKRPHLSVFGSDYNTHDGTGVRDYIHVVDLAKGHLKALEKLAGGPGRVVYNLGTGAHRPVHTRTRAYHSLPCTNLCPAALISAPLH